jgi:hypothetical protein
MRTMSTNTARRVVGLMLASTVKRVSTYLNVGLVVAILLAGISSGYAQVRLSPVLYRVILDGQTVFSTRNLDYARHIQAEHPQSKIIVERAPELPSEDDNN